MDGTISNVGLSGTDLLKQSPTISEESVKRSFPIMNEISTKNTLFASLILKLIEAKITGTVYLLINTQWKGHVHQHTVPLCGLQSWGTNIII